MKYLSMTVEHEDHDVLLRFVESIRSLWITHYPEIGEDAVKMFISPKPKKEGDAG